MVNKRFSPVAFSCSFFVFIISRVGLAGNMKTAQQKLQQSSSSSEGSSSEGSSSEGSSSGSTATVALAMRGQLKSSREPLK
jgi:hypothetical protein